MIQVRVVYATVSMQTQVLLELPADSVLLDAVKASKLCLRYPEINQRPLVVGIFGEIIHEPEKFQLFEGDRVEIYRSLLIDPKDARRSRTLLSKT